MQKSLKTAQAWGRPETFFSGRLRNNIKVSQGRGARSRAATRVLPWLSMLLLIGSPACNKESTNDPPLDGGIDPAGDSGVPDDLALGPQPICSKDGYCWRNPLPQGNGINGLYVGSGGEIVTVGDRGTILRYSGGNWTQEASGTQNLLNAVWGPSAKDLWAVGGNGMVLRYNGSTWTPQASGTPFLLNLSLIHI